MERMSWVVGTGTGAPPDIGGLVKWDLRCCLDWVGLGCRELEIKWEREGELGRQLLAVLYIIRLLSPMAATMV